ncbi:MULTISPECIES: type II toxin-antitoxin system Phd/YefM family antitoxin [Pseudomonas]|jgi:prevent-host-death family protein|uniref:Antitoxin n=1 Tax=Pseudomonas citronellolis TaxID=53408 RepID=A0A127MMH2_9PSED|nr:MULTISPECIES: type II toxin-antitoxin system Phd/YefM family antitoxin [Pseudomonas]KSW26059.1 antitoxin, Phd family protein [Pseudomonas sp. ADP]AMO74410.1 Phd_YefM [Pseudomonas citronellolis]ANI13260.1 antitoxin, Phd family protein [Pseudomonas citronellolis]KES20410.1 antitoxin, Phd family protein [Pseudomonas sp. AAC]KRV65634.1 antitoxin, Phd family protein [Pseudomonas citronellolis]
MRYSSQVKPISYLKANAAEVLKQLGEQQEPLIITQNGEAKAVIQDVRSYEETQETLALLKLLALGNQEIEEGRFAALDEVAKRLRGDA